jgi:hypothetical protein
MSGEIAVNIAKLPELLRKAKSAFFARYFAQSLRCPTGIKFDYRIACPRKAKFSAKLLRGFELIQSKLESHQTL